MQHTAELTTDSPRHLIAAALHELLVTVDRATPLGEAQVAALEAAHKLLEADGAAYHPSEIRTEILREALGSARAAVSAAATATVLAQDMWRHEARAAAAGGRPQPHHVPVPSPTAPAAARPPGLLAPDKESPWQSTATSRP